jgi:hypothetical protein
MTLVTGVKVPALPVPAGGVMTRLAKRLAVIQAQS